MSVERMIDDAVRLFYAAATGEVAWTAALDPMLAATGFDGAALYAYNRTKISLETTNQFDKGIWHHLNDEVQTDYLQHYIKLDPRFHHYARHPDLRICHDYLHTSEERIDHDPYYDWYLKTQPTRYYVGARTPAQMPIFGSVTLHRRASLGPVQPEEIDRFGLLFDHVERALLVEYQIFRAGFAADADLVENNPTGLALLDRRGRVVHANPALRRMVAAADAFSLSAEGLTAAHSDGDQALQSAIGVALAADGCARPAAPLRIARSTGKRDYLVIVTAMTARGGLFRDWAPAASILVIDPTRGPEPSLEVLRQLFRLTQAEARLAALLLGEGTIEEAGTALGVSMATVRSHLAALFRKTGTNRQGELIRLLSSIPWASLSDL